MDLNDFLGPNPIIIELQAIDELIAGLVMHGKLTAEKSKTVAESVKKREMAMTTGIGYGIGIPHASTSLVTEVIGIIGRSCNEVEFEALDTKPVRLVMLFLVPEGCFQKHLRELANIAKLLHKQDFRDGLGL